MPTITHLIAQLRSSSQIEFTPDQAVDAYRQQLASAPSRAKRYFVVHRRRTPSQGNSNRGEEHLAMALCKAERVILPEGTHLHWLDYQFPLKARRADHGIGKIDLLGRGDDGRLWVVELKAERSGEEPRMALLQGLAYAAIVEANLERIACEAEDKFKLMIRRERPRIALLAPVAYWLKARRRWTMFAPLKRRVEQALSLTIDCVGLPAGSTEARQFGPASPPIRLIDLRDVGLADG